MSLFDDSPKITANKNDVRGILCCTAARCASGRVGGRARMARRPRERSETLCYRIDLENGLC